MKRLFLSLYLLSILIGCNKKYISYNDIEIKNFKFYKKCEGIPYTGEVKIFYKNSRKLTEEFNVKDGKIKGVAKGYYYNGQVAYEQNYKNGKREGIQKIYNEKGELTNKKLYINGILKN